jgi:hypothetical protein
LKSASLSEIKNELVTLMPNDILALCMRLAKYKKDNKELLTYLLFEASDERGYVNAIKSEIDIQFEVMNKTNLYFVKKNLRKTLRITNKNIKYSGSKQTEVELLIYFCLKMKKANLPIQGNTVIANIYKRQKERIKKAASTLHEDIQYDFKEDIESLV